MLFSSGTDPSVSLLVGTVPTGMAPKPAGNGAQNVREKKNAATPLKLDGNGNIPTQMRRALQKNLARVIDLFRQIDDDASGYIDGPEFVKAMGELGFKGDQPSVTALFASFDPNDSGTIEYRELHDLLVRSVQHKPELEPLQLTAANRIALRKKRISKVDANMFSSNHLRGTMKLDRVPGAIREMLDEHKARVVDLFRQFDDDSSGLLDFAEFNKAMTELGMKGVPIEAMAAVFASFDPDQSGTIEYRELFDAIKKSFKERPVLPPLPLRAANKIALRTKKIIKCNANLLGGLDLDEAALHSLPGQIKGAMQASMVRVIDVFRQFDDDANGSIAYEEFCKAMSELGLDVAPDALEMLFKEWDTDGSGLIEYEEVRKHLHDAEVVDFKGHSHTGAGFRGGSRPGSGRPSTAAQPQSVRGAGGKGTSSSGLAGGLATVAEGVAGRPQSAPAKVPEGVAGRPQSAPPTVAGRLSPTRKSSSLLGASSKGSSGHLRYRGPPIEPAQLYWRPHPLHCQTVHIGTASGSEITAFEIVGGRSALVHRGANKLAIVMHPLGAGSRMAGRSEYVQTPRGMATPHSQHETHAALARARWLAGKVATRPLHQKLVDEGFNVLAYEAHSLAVGNQTVRGVTSVQTVADAAMDAKHALRVQQAKLRDVLAYVEKHRVFRYCRVVILAQGVGASAALQLLADLNPTVESAAPDTAHVNSPRVAKAVKPIVKDAWSPDLSTLSLFRLRAVAASQPSPEAELLDRVAPRCPVPVLLAYAQDAPPETIELTTAVHAALPEPGPDEHGKELLAIPQGAVPLFGKARRFEGGGYWGEHPEALLAFLNKHF